jgi:phage gp16-like protein
MASTTTAAVPAAASDKTRNLLLAKVHLAKKQLALDVDTYEGVLLRVAGVTSAKDCTIPQLRLVVEDFTRRGFTSRARRPGQSPRADHPMARKARATWISLSLLCAIDVEPDAAIKEDKALEAFAKRQLGTDRLQWANQSQSDRLIEGLKAMAERHGWDQSVKGLAKVHYVHALKVRLCDAILAKLKRAGLAHADWTLGGAAFRLCGIGSPSDAPRMMWTPQEADQMAAALGRHLRAHGGRAACRPMVQGQGA